MGMVEDLSPDAAFFGGSMFAMMEPEVGTLVFLMVESRPTTRSKAALDELVAHGYLSVAPYNQFGGVVYTLRKPIKRATEASAKRAGHWPITEPFSRAIHQAEAHNDEA